jgi:MFS family permease
VAARLSRGRFFGPHLVEWRVVAVAFSLFVVSFGYGGVTSFVAVYAEQNGIVPKGIFFTTFALVVLVTRLGSGRLADRIGHRRFLVPCLGLAALGLLVLPFARTRGLMVLSAVVFAAGFGNMYPAFVAHVMKHVDPSRRGAAFDTGIGTGSITTGALAQHFGFPPAFAVAAVLSALSIPIFLWTEKRFLRRP